MKNRLQIWFLKIIILTIISAMVIQNSYQASAKTIFVGKDYQLKNLSDAVAFVAPGDTIRFQKGIYPGIQIIKALKGKKEAWITLFASVSDSVIIRGEVTSWQFTDPAYLLIEGFIFEEQTGNGMNIDDGSDYSTPAQHLIIRNCIFRNIKANGNNDLLKLSGLNNFEITGCKFLNGSPGGSGIDMVGCHQGKIVSCEFVNQGSNSIQAKGGSQHIRIIQNKFKNGGQRSINLGGSTGLPFFRPMDAAFEAANLEVYSNIFIGSDSPIAFVGCINSKVANNTIYMPKRWIVRILQENLDPRFIQCGDNSFSNNLVCYENLRTEINIGMNTRPETFGFANNFWFDLATANSHPPAIPGKDSTIVYGANPNFLDPENGNFMLKKDSPAIGRIKSKEEPLTDYFNRPYKLLRSFGAIEH